MLRILGWALLLCAVLDLIAFGIFRAWSQRQGRWDRNSLAGWLILLSGGVCGALGIAFLAVG